MTKRLFLATLTILGVSVWARHVGAVEADAETLALSNSLFETGKRDLAKRNVIAACDSFERSYALVPRVGTLLNLGLCHEQQGRLLAARSDLQAAIQMLESTSGRPDRMAIAEEHLRAIEAALSWVDLDVAPEIDRTQVELTLDGAPVLPAVDSVPVESGEHRIEVRSRGFITRTIVAVVGPAQRWTVHIDPLQRSPVPIGEQVAPPQLLTTRKPTTPTVTIQTQMPGESDRRRISPWIWVGGGVAIAAGVAAAIVLAMSHPRYPSSDVRGTYP
jgi:hypothetical protein